MKFLLSVLMSAAFAACAAAGDFHDLRVQYGHIESFYKNLSEVKEPSPRYDDLEKRLEAFQKAAAAVQCVTDTMPCMDDLAFSRYAEIMLGIFRKSGLSRRQDKKTTAKGSLFSASDIPFKMMFELLDSDIEELLDIKFSPSAKVKTIHSAELFPEYYQFHRFLRYYRSVGVKIGDYSKNLPWRTMFAQRMEKMKACAVKLRARMEKEFPEVLKRYDPVVETNFLADYFYEKQPDSMMSGSGKKTLKGNVSAEKSDPDRDVRQNMNFSARRLENMCRILRKELKKLDQEFDGIRTSERREQQRKQKDSQRKELREAQDTLREAAAEKPDGAEQKAVPEKRTVPPERMSESELRRELENRRNAVFPSDEQKTLTKEQYEACRATLSADQKDMLESIRLRRIRSGESAPQAEIESLRELKPLLGTKNLSLNKKEMLLLLKDGGTKEQNGD